MKRHLAALYYVCVIVITPHSTDTDSCFNLHDYSPPPFNYHLLELSPHISLTGDAGNSRAELTWKIF